MDSKAWKRSSNAPAKGSPLPRNKMRYYVFYPVTKSITLIDVDENVHVEEIVELAKRKFGLRVYGNGPSEASVVLSYNGFDLKPKWCISDIGIPSGAIIHCLYQEQKAADLYVYCAFGKSVLELFDSSIDMETKIGTIRQIIARKIGLPLSTFCLETYSGSQRLYDEMRLIDYDIKTHDRVYLKVWQGYDKFIGTCVKGHIEWYAPDELTRHYQAQVALHIAAFYGHLELAGSILRQGARTDRPVGEPPSRQWSSTTAIEMFPEMLRCPIHIAIERGHVILVDRFVRNSILCTQTCDPITGKLPYQLALSYSAKAKTAEEKRSYRSIYFYLYNKQYYLKIPLNANGEYISNLLTSTSNTNAVHRPSAHHVNVCLAMYCRIIRWCERAREKTWKRFGGQFSSTQMKRVYPETGLLGYKVLIDGYNNTFEVPPEQLRAYRSSAAIRADQRDQFAYLSDEEREKLNETKARMKKFVSDDQHRFKHAIGSLLHHERRSTLVPPDIAMQLRKDSVAVHDTPNLKTARSIVDASRSPILSSTLPAPPLSGAVQREDSHLSKGKPKRMWPLSEPTSRLSAHNEKDKHALPAIISSMSNPTPTHSSLSTYAETVTNNTQHASSSAMSAADAYLYSSTLLAREIEQQNDARRRDLFAHIEQSVKETQAKQVPRQSSERIIYSSNRLSNSFPADRGTMIDLDLCLPLPEHPMNLGVSPVKSRHDRDVRDATFKSYERYASASIRSTAVNCLQEANHFKRKPWIKQVEISKEMIKHKVHRRMDRANENNRKSALTSLSASTTRMMSPHKSNAVKVN